MKKIVNENKDSGIQYRPNKNAKQERRKKKPASPYEFICHNCQQGFFLR